MATQEVHEQLTFDFSSANNYVHLWVESCFLFTVSSICNYDKWMFEFHV